jgi:hypothetical protein
LQSLAVLLRAVDLKALSGRGLMTDFISDAELAYKYIRSRNEAKPVHDPEYGVKVNSRKGVRIAQTNDFVKDTLRFKFGTIGDHFIVDTLPYTTMLGFPDEIGGDFTIESCLNLKNFEFGPKTVGGAVIIRDCAFESFKGFPKKAKSLHIIRNKYNISAEGWLPLLFLEITNFAIEKKGYYKVLMNGRDNNGKMPRELIPTKINQLRDLDGN